MPWVLESHGFNCEMYKYFLSIIVIVSFSELNAQKSSLSWGLTSNIVLKSNGGNYVFDDTLYLHTNETVNFTSIGPVVEYQLPVNINNSIFLRSSYLFNYLHQVSFGRIPGGRRGSIEGTGIEIEHNMITVGIGYETKLFIDKLNLEFSLGYRFHKSKYFNLTDHLKSINKPKSTIDLGNSYINGLNNYSFSYAVGFNYMITEYLKTFVHYQNMLSSFVGAVEVNDSSYHLMLRRESFNIGILYVYDLSLN